MTVTEWIHDASVKITVTVIGALGAAVIWLIRRILTNQKQIELLRAELAARDVLRQEDRKAFAEVQKDIREMRAEIRQLFRGQAK